MAFPQDGIDVNSAHKLHLASMQLSGVHMCGCCISFLSRCLLMLSAAGSAKLSTWAVQNYLRVYTCGIQLRTASVKLSVD